MKMRSRITPTLLLSALSACAVAGAGANGPERLSIEFGQDQYLSDAYLTTTPGASCGHHALAPGNVEVSAPLPDGTWFRVFAVGAAPLGGGVPACVEDGRP